MNPGHVENFLLLMDFIRVIFGGLNADWWRYLINATFDIMVYVFLSWCSVSHLSIVRWFLFGACMGKTHNHVHGSLPTFHTILLLK